MKKITTYFKKILLKEKKLILFLWLLLLIGLGFGLFFITILDEPDQSLLLEHLTNFFQQLKHHQLDYNLALCNSITANLLYVFIIWFLGISIIGIPIILLLVFLKGFIIGFSIASMITNFKLIGLLGAFIYIFPHHLIMSFIIVIVSSYALAIAFNLFWALIKRREMNFKNIINRYSLIMLFSLIIVSLTSCWETYITPYLLKMILIFIKI